MDRDLNLWYTKRVVKRGELTSKPIKALVSNEDSDSDVLHDVEELHESNYGAELYFENGVMLFKRWRIVN